MYQVYYGDMLVYDPRGANCAEPGDTTYALTEGRLSLSVGSAGRLTMTLAAGHPAIEKITVRVGVVKVVELIGSTATTVFLGRVISDTLNLDNSRTYECEGRLACLNDTVGGPGGFPQGQIVHSDDYQNAVRNQTIPQFRLRQILTAHNSMAITADSQVLLGTVTVSGGRMSRTWNGWETHLQRLMSDLPNSSLGGYLIMRYSGDTAYLDYLADFTGVNAQAVSFSQNLLDLTRSAHGADYFNSVLPVGKDGLTCAAAADGSYGDYYKTGNLVTTPAAQQAGYGNVVRVVKWEDVETATELVSKAVAYLDAAVAAIDEITISAADLSGLDPSVEPFRIGKLLRIDNPPQGLRATVAVVGLDIDITGDVDVKLTLGSKGVSLTSGGSGVNAITLAGDTDAYVRVGGDTMTGPLEIVLDGTNGRALLRVTDDGRGNLQLYRPDGTLSVNIYALGSAGEIDIHDGSGTMRAALYSNTTLGGLLRLCDTQGNYETLSYNNLTALLALLPSS